MLDFAYKHIDELAIFQQYLRFVCHDLKEIKKAIKAIEENDLGRLKKYPIIFTLINNKEDQFSNLSIDESAIKRITTKYVNHENNETVSLISELQLQRLIKIDVLIKVIYLMTEYDDNERVKNRSISLEPLLNLIWDSLKEHNLKFKGQLPSQEYERKFLRRLKYAKDYNLASQRFHMGFVKTLECLLKSEYLEFVCIRKSVINELNSIKLLNSKMPNEEIALVDFQPLKKMFQDLILALNFD